MLWWERLVDDAYGMLSKPRSPCRANNFCGLGGRQKDFYSHYLYTRDTLKKPAENTLEGLNKRFKNKEN
jgi:hypothetical protein